MDDSNSSDNDGFSLEVIFLLEVISGQSAAARIVWRQAPRLGLTRGPDLGLQVMTLTIYIF